jgi:hypothetical protein
MPYRRAKALLHPVNRDCVYEGEGLKALLHPDNLSGMVLKKEGAAPSPNPTVWFLKRLKLLASHIQIDIPQRGGFGGEGDGAD